MLLFVLSVSIIIICIAVICRKTKEIDQLKSLYKKSEIRYNNLHEKFSSLQQKYSASQEKERALNKLNISLTEKLERRDEDISALEGAVGKSTKERDESMEEVSRLGLVLEMKDNQINNLEWKLDQRNMRISALEADVENLTKARDESMVKVARLSSMLAMKDDQIHDLEGKLEQVNQARTASNPFEKLSAW